jgi:Tfp pilus assembly protein PilX
MRRKDGFILLFVIIIILVLSAFIAVGMALVLNIQRSLNVSFDVNSKADEVANAGIEDAIS